MFSALPLYQTVRIATTTQQQMPEAVVRRCSVTKEVLRNFPKFTGKYLYQRLAFNKVAGLVTKEVLRNFAKIHRKTPAAETHF